MKKRALIGVALATIATSLFLWAKARQNVVLEGTYQTSFEESAFFVDGDCGSRPAWWKWPDESENEMYERWIALGKPEALRVKVRGNLSHFGIYGHLGKYHREFKPLQIVAASPTARCKWSWGDFSPR